MPSCFLSYQGDNAVFCPLSHPNLLFIKSVITIAQISPTSLAHGLSRNKKKAIGSGSM